MPIVAIDLDGLEEQEVVTAGTITRIKPVLDKAITQEMAKASKRVGEAGGKND